MSDIRIARLFVYPLKSAAGIETDSLVFDDRGPINDRRWMLVDADGGFLSQRRVPRMALLQVSLCAETLRVTAPGMADLLISLDANEAESRECQVARLHQESVQVRRVNREADEWFSRFMGKQCHLVEQTPGLVRFADRTYAPDGTIVGLADGFPILLIGQASLDELNRRLALRGHRPVTFDRFRPNVVASGAHPHAEDAWQRILARDMELMIVKPCARCAIVNVNQLTGRQELEPLKTLAEYRRRGAGVYFGQNAVHRGAGSLRVGESIAVETCVD